MDVLYVLSRSLPVTFTWIILTLGVCQDLTPQRFHKNVAHCLPPEFLHTQCYDLLLSDLCKADGLPFSAVELASVVYIGTTRKVHVVTPFYVLCGTLRRKNILLGDVSPFQPYITNLNASLPVDNSSAVLRTQLTQCTEEII